MCKSVTLLGLILVLPNLMAQQLTDPTKPLQPTMTAAAVAETGGAQPLKLQSILTVSGVRTAIISGQSYQVGSVIADFEISEISKSKVVLYNASERIELALFGTAMTINDENRHE